MPPKKSKAVDSFLQAISNLLMGLSLGILQQYLSSRTHRLHNNKSFTKQQLAKMRHTRSKTVSCSNLKSTTFEWKISLKNQRLKPKLAVLFTEPFKPSCRWVSQILSTGSSRGTLQQHHSSGNNFASPNPAATTNLAQISNWSQSDTPGMLEISEFFIL